MKDLTVATGSVSIGEVTAHKKQTKEDGSPLSVITCTVDGGAYVQSLEKHGLKLEDLKKFQKHDAEYLTELQKDAADAGAKILKENKDADRVVFVAPYGADKLSNYTSNATIEIDRVKKVVNLATKETSYVPTISCKVTNKFQKTSDNLKKELKHILQSQLAAN